MDEAACLIPLRTRSVRTTANRRVLGDCSGLRVVQSVSRRRLYLDGDVQFARRVVLAPASAGRVPSPTTQPRRLIFELLTTSPTNVAPGTPTRSVWSDARHHPGDARAQGISASAAPARALARRSRSPARLPWSAASVRGGDAQMCRTAIGPGTADRNHARPQLALYRLDPVFEPLPASRPLGLDARPGSAVDCRRAPPSPRVRTSPLACHRLSVRTTSSRARRRRVPARLAGQSERLRPQLRRVRSSRGDSQLSARVDACWAPTSPDCERRTALPATRGPGSDQREPDAPLKRCSWASAVSGGSPAARAHEPLQAAH